MFALEDGEGHRIYQLTSSAVTYNLSLPQSWVLRLDSPIEYKVHTRGVTAS